MNNAEMAMVQYQRGTLFRQKVKSVLCWIITFLVLFLIVLLAIPVCLFITLISGVWNIADLLLRRLDG